MALQTEDAAVADGIDQKKMEAELDSARDGTVHTPAERLKAISKRAQEAQKVIAILKTLYTKV